jgi:hypothetical protein
VADVFATVKGPELYSPVTKRTSSVEIKALLSEMPTDSLSNYMIQEFSRLPTAIRLTNELAPTTLNWSRRLHCQHTATSTQVSLPKLGCVATEDTAVTAAHQVKRCTGDGVAVTTTECTCPFILLVSSVATVLQVVIFFITARNTIRRLGQHLYWPTVMNRRSSALISLHCHSQCHSCVT